MMTGNHNKSKTINPGGKVQCLDPRLDAERGGDRSDTLSCDPQRGSLNGLVESQAGQLLMMKMNLVTPVTGF